MIIKAIVLCAGYGTRMKEYSKECHKVMLPLECRPLLEYTLSHLERSGISEIGINLHYRGEQIVSYFDNNQNLKVKIHYEYEKKPTGTAGGVKIFESFLKEADHFFVIYGDLITNFSIQDLLKFHLERKGLGSIALHQREKSNSMVEIDASGRICSFHERPPESFWKDKKDILVNSGIYLFKKDVLQYIKEDTFADFPRDIFPKLIDEKLLYGKLLKGHRWAIDSPKRYEQLKNEFDSSIFNEL